MNNLPSQAVVEVQRLVKDLVEERFMELEKDGRSGRLSAAELHDALARYGRQMVHPPHTAFEQLDVVEIENTNTQTWSVEFPVWTREDGLSDWTLDLTVKDNLDGSFSVEIDDFHVH